MHELPNIICGKSYHIMDIKDPDYAMLMMTTYGALENLEKLGMQWRHKGSGKEVTTKRFNSLDIFGNHFHYRHQVDNNKNNCLYLIYVEKTWATTYWTDH